MLSSNPKNGNGNEEKANNIINHLNYFIMSTKVNSESANVVVVKGNVTNVTLPNAIENRVTISLDCEPFESIDFNTGETIEKTAFGVNISNLVNQVKDSVEAIGLASALAMGQRVNPQIVSLALNGASIVVERTFHKKGDAREVEGVYERDCWISKITAVTPHIKPSFQAMLDKLVVEKPCITSTVTTKTVLNPFGI